MKNIFALLLSIFIYATLPAQQITYTQPEPEDLRSLDFEIIGKINNNFLIYKHIRNDYAVSVYDQNMELKNRLNWDFMPSRTLNVDFVWYPEFAYLIYQYQKRGVVYCMAAQIDGEGKLLKEPFELDTTAINFAADNKIYSTTFSEDRSKIMIYKIQKKNDRFNFTTLLFNDNLQLQKKTRIETSYEERKDVFSDFLVDNNGNFVFTKSTKSSSRDYLEDADLLIQMPGSDTFHTQGLALDGNYLDEIKLKVDNVNHNFLITSLYYPKKRANVEGLFTAVYSEENHEFISQNFTELNDSVRTIAKTDGSMRYALNNFFIKDIILKKDGGFLLAAEDYTSQSRGNPFNRFNYLYGYPYYNNSYYLYSPSYYGYYGRSPWYYNNRGQVRYYYDNILVMNFDNTGNVLWANVIRKSQYDDNSDNYLSYNSIVSGGELHFLFNELERRNHMVHDQSISPDGNVTRYPPLRNLDKGYEFMPRYAKQVSSYQVIVPCTYRNYICFAKIDF